MIECKDKERIVSGRKPNSYGMDILEIQLLGDDLGRSLEIEFYGLSDVVEFDVQILQIDEVDGGRIHGKEEIQIEQEEKGSMDTRHYAYSIPLDEYYEDDQFALIVTRIDDNEIVDPDREYEINLR